MKTEKGQKHGLRAYYGTRRGGSGGRSLTSVAEVEKILRGGYGVTTVRIVDADGNEIGNRWEHWEHGRRKWLWCYEPDSVRLALATAAGDNPSTPTEPR